LDLSGRGRPPPSRPMTRSESPCVRVTSVPLGRRNGETLHCASSGQTRKPTLSKRISVLLYLSERRVWFGAASALAPSSAWSRRAAPEGLTNLLACSLNFQPLIFRQSAVFFSLTTNRSTILSAVYFQPSEQARLE
jgi:hypothetical protein